MDTLAAVEPVATLADFRSLSSRGTTRIVNIAVVKILLAQEDIQTETIPGAPMHAQASCIERQNEHVMARLHAGDRSPLAWRHEV